jgi:UDP-N-acetylmuramate dehydrogenase
MNIEANVPLREHTTFHIGGSADAFVVVRSEDELVEAVKYAQQHELKITVMAGGSNMLVADEGVRGLVIKVAIPGIAYEPTGTYETNARVGAGVMLDDLVADTVTRGFWGLENLSAIPGTVGATPVQNVGAYGVEVASRIVSVRALDCTTGVFREFTNIECNFGYRMSFFKTNEGARYIITSVVFCFTKIPTPHVQYADLRRAFADADPTLLDIRTEVMRIRSEKFPDWHVIGTAGSFFKNPHITAAAFHTLRERYSDAPGYDDGRGLVKVPLGWIIDKVLGMKGAREGNVGTYAAQSLVIVNHGGATAAEVDAFARTIESRVHEATGITIEREVRMYL